MQTTEFEVCGQRYSCSRMKLRDANIVVRRMSGVLMWMAQARRALADANAALKKGEAALPPPSSEAFAQAIVGMSNDMSQQDCDTAYGLCLATVQRRVAEGGWQRVSAGGEMLFEDIDLMAQQQIVYNVLLANGLVDFFLAGSSPPSGSSAQG